VQHESCDIFVLKEATARCALCLGIYHLQYWAVERERITETSSFVFLYQKLHSSCRSQEINPLVYTTKKVLPIVIGVRSYNVTDPSTVQVATGRLI
jgi:hypothetical protein